MKLLTEFKNFIAKGNVLDLAVGVIIGAAFGAIVSSLVNDVIMPPISFYLGGVDVSKLGPVLGKNAEGKDVIWPIGKFLQSIINLLIVGFAVFMIVRAFNRTKKINVTAYSAWPRQPNLNLMGSETTTNPPATKVSAPQATMIPAVGSIGVDTDLSQANFASDNPPPNDPNTTAIAVKENSQPITQAMTQDSRHKTELQQLQILAEIRDLLRRQNTP